ncbi:MAG: exopolyphosphatase [Bacteroidetes bacterium]|nr:exopolyphosphatase [Bacteroidota bacterium]
MKLAAIDIGSNAMRLLLCHVYLNNNNEPAFKKADLIRVPIRLGEDSFLLGRISPRKQELFFKAMQAFKNLMDIHGAVDYRACATSAMRDASNGPEIIEYIKKEIGLTIEIVDGKTEANIIYSNHVEEHLDKNQSYLYIDIGGGSTELTLFSKNKVVLSQSFNIGTIRLLHNQVDKQYWNFFKDWIKANTKSYKPLTAIGSGGNINKLFKMTNRKPGKSVPYSKVKYLYDLLSNYSYEERMKVFEMNPDRADVIVPATRIVLAVMKAANIENMIVPQIGLSDGLIHQLYEKHKDKVTASVV